MSEGTLTINQPERHYLPADFVMTDWESLKPYFEELYNRSLTNVADLKAWMQDRSELEAVIGENAALRFINHTRDTQDEDAKARYLDFVRNIQPKLSPWEHALNEQFEHCPFKKELDQDTYYNYLRLNHNEVLLYREENIPLFTEIEEEAQEYGSITGQMTVTIDGEEMPLPKAAVYLRKPDRQKRQQVFETVNDRRLKDADQLQSLFDKLLEKRHKVAQNAGYDNFRDYQFDALGRFDYTVTDVQQFHTAIQREIVPLQERVHQQRQTQLGVDTLRPYDLSVDPTGKPPLKPAADSQDLVEKTVQCFNQIHPDFGNYLRIMQEQGYLDLDTRKGKAPGGYNYPLDEVGIPFIFMNAKGDFSDLVTMVHEGGHAIHAFLTRDYKLNTFKHPPSEVAELASMAMELISMEHWDVIFPDTESLLRAKVDQLKGVISTFPWVATISQFQHWLYTNPGHTQEERNQAWLRIHRTFGSKLVNWSGYEQYESHSWLKQLHLFEVPFYYIEYAMAQMGAIGIWKNYRKQPEKALEQYIDALKLGYTKTIPEIYETAGIRFDLSEDHLKALATFLREELANLETQLAKHNA